MSPPKYLLKHPAILEIEDMLEESCGSYKWGILLKEGWTFECGRNAGGRCLNINNQADLLYSNPVEKNND